MEKLDFKIMKTKALEETNFIIIEKLKDNINKTFIQDYSKNIYKIIEKNSNPILLSVIEKNKDELNKEIDKLNELETPLEDKIFAINGKINSLLGVFAKAKLSISFTLIVKDTIKLMKLINSKTETNINKKTKNEKQLKDLIKKYDLKM